MEREEVVDFSANLNPLGPPEEVLEAARGGVAEVSGYPEPFQRGLRDRIASAEGVSPGEVLVGAGSTELIFLAAALLEGGSVALGRHGFAEYRRAAGANGVSVVEVDTGVPPSVDAYRDCLKDVDGCFLCSPHNPSGSSLEGVEDLVEEFPDTLFVVDRAYAAFEPPGKGVELRGLGNAVELRSLTKSFSVPGLRLGYCVADPEVVEEMLGFKQPWTVGQVATGAAEACLDLDGFLERSRRFVEGEKRFLWDELGERFEVAPSDANFLLTEVGDAAGAKRALLEEGLLVRDCSSFGLPRHVRVAPRSREENAELAEAMLELPRDSFG